MKTTLSKLFFTFFLLISVWGKAQTNPTAFNLASSGNYSFTTWAAASPAGTYPANMVFHNFDVNDATLATAIAGSNITGVYNSASATSTRMNGLGAGGFSFKNNNGTVVPPYVNRRLGEAVLALNTTDRTNIQVSWLAGRVGSNTPVYAITCQYRIGTSGAYTTLPGTAQYLSTNASTSVAFGPITLPASCDNKPVVQLRWAYTYISGTTTISCPQLFVDDISVTSIPLVTITPISNTCSTSPAFALTDGQPAGGVYSGPGVSGGTFDPAAAGTGTHTITYTYTDGNGISNFTTTNVEVDPMHCIVTSKLKASSCGATGLSPNSWIYCESSPGATSYTFFVTNTSLGYSAQWTINAPYLGVSLLKFPGLQYGATYNVTVKVLSGGVLSAAGAVCTITLGSLPTSSLTTASCGATGLTRNSYIYCNGVSGATQYNWTFTNSSLGFSYTWSPAGPYKSLQMNRIPGLVAGQTYNVTVTAVVGGITTQPGAVCPITLSSAFMVEYEGDGSKEFLEMNTLSSIVYPNPVSLDAELKIQLNEIQTTTVIITDVMGRLVFEKQFAEMDLINISLAGMGISPGIYNVAVSNGTTIENNKIVVTK
jgi:hypothetical protein